jgi:TetR/AcrR family transcriptional repressor of nem operon
MDITPTATRIMDVAERMARTGGYSGFSFREIASEISIKPASVHYHFPTKADLGAALAERYTARFLEALGQPTDASPSELRRRYVDAFRASLRADRLMCLCGMFGSEFRALPDPVARQTTIFFERNIAWLTRALAPEAGSEEAAGRQALAMLATLEGAMILARSLGDDTAFDVAVARLL